jgi:TolB protein
VSRSREHVWGSILGLAVALASAFLVAGASAASQDSGLIAFVTSRDDEARCARTFEEGDGECNWEIYVMNDGGASQRRLIRSSAWEGSPTWSPDGRRIAFERSGDGVWVANADGTGERQVMAASVTLGLTWSPNGKRIAYGRFGGGIWVMNADGTGQRRLTRSTDVNPDWSSKGEIAFWRWGGGIWTMNADGTGQRRLIRSGLGEDDPAWSPNGMKIAFPCGASDGTRICVMNAKGKDRRTLTRGRFVRDSEPTWSPDGSRIAFSRRSDPPADVEVFVVNVNGNRQTRLTAAGINRSPNWQR